MFILFDCILQNMAAVQNFRLGQVLTIIDASIVDKEQRKAIKDLIKNAFNEREYYADEIAEVLIQFHSVTRLNLFKDSDERRQFLGKPRQSELEGVGEYLGPDWFANCRDAQSSLKE